MSTSADHHVQVAIVGAGPVGLGLAIALGQRGIRSLLIERHLEPLPIPKGQNLTQRTLEHFYFWGAEAELRAARTIPRAAGIGGLTAYGSLLSPYAYDWLQRELVREFYFTANERLPQYATEAVLRRRAADLPEITARYGWQAASVATTADGVSVEMQAPDGRRETAAGAYLVGCDGSHSTVRDAVGITQQVEAHGRRMVLLVFRSPALHELLAERFPAKSYFSVLHPEHQGYWQFIGRVDVDARWFYHGPVPAGTTRETVDPAAHIARAVGCPVGIDVEYVGFWDLRIAVADTYRAGRVFIAGDAAHSHPPYGGYGINTGLEDAVNLAWKLAFALAGRGGPRLLDSYSEERRAVFASTARDFIGYAIARDRDFLACRSPEADRAGFERAWAARAEEARAEIDQFEPHYEGSPIVFGPPGAESRAVGHHTFAARPGHHLAPAVLSNGPNVYERLGSGFTLLAFGADPRQVRAFTDAARRADIPLTVVTGARDDSTGRYDSSLVLVRPDQFVAWTGEGASDDPTDVLRRLTGH